MYKSLMALFMIFFWLAVQSPCVVQAQSPLEILDQYISDLQNSPDDYALREQIIKHVQAMTPPPAIPEEARRNYVMAETLFKEAKNVQEYTDALVKYKAALLIAPWWADAYVKMGLACEEAQQYDEAINALKLYIVASPDSDKARKAQDEIYIIEAKKEKAAMQSSPEAVAEKKQTAYAEWLKKIDGAGYRACNEYNPAECLHLSVRGNSAFYSTGYSGEEGPWLIEDRRFAAWTYQCFDGRKGRANCLISQDGDRITCTYCEGENPPRVFKREW